ncbi:ABC transporter ATP-binding protein [Flavobacterium sp. '19STA2R22 D10 B1']|uniref:ABC transporter ATP-binding protein n=1 Tax=Flavobacterium aerium TaxID=3037261 RepID=UPI00278C5935|nr:ABC transporter ATP-binding protein [Flavobacterium sp. '19STA2R22 D10 B1']
MKTNQSLLDASAITIGYHHKKQNIVIAKDISVVLDKSKLITLVGPNGIGKSTLLRTLTGIQKPINGQVVLNNKNIDQYTPLELAQTLSVVLTESLPPSNLTVYELVALGRQPYTNWLGTLAPEDIEKVNRAIEITQIDYIKHKKHYEISDGQLQKVLVARALAQDTPLIILDEPTTHLDLFHKVSLFKLLKKLTQETDKCILFSTHDIDLAIQLSDEMIIMTKDDFIQDTPCKHIEKGTFNTIFKDDAIIFDAEKGKFIIS